MSRGLLAVIVGLAIALVLSLAGNAWLAHQYLEARDAKTKAEGEARTAQNAANACAQSVRDLRKRAEDAEKEGAAAREAAAKLAREHEQHADEILNTPASVPGNDCQSARERIDNWLRRRQ